jgi:large subunit ribosomal protein L15
VKILAKGSLTKALTVRAHRFSARAQELIAGAGGKAEVLGAAEPGPRP